MNKLITTLCLICLALYVHSQTIGTIVNTEDSYDGYTLFNGGPGNGGGGGGGGGMIQLQGVYLINNCGELVNSWLSENFVGLSSKLMHDGSIVRGIRLNQINTISGGGSGGGVEILDWDGTQKWEFDYNLNGVHLQHHDVMPLPNGNVLIMGWEANSSQVTAALGRQDGSPVQSDHIIEVTPNYIDGTSATIVWQWYAIDHTVQNVNPTLSNYGDLLENNHRLNINNGDGNDWLHCNGIEYIEEFDQIAISSKDWSEMFVIDHSTTIAEAASGSGGNYGKGGDFLYRWGRPVNYNGSGSQTLASNHGIRYSPTSYENGRTFSIFSNQGGGNNESTIVSWTPPLNSDGTYSKEADGSFGPAAPDFEVAVQQANTGSTCQGMPNGNLMYCANSQGELGEYDLDGNLVWHYVIPTNAGGAMTQGSNPSASSFNAERYASTYPGLADKDLTPGLPIELNPLVGNCTLYPIEVVIDPPVATFVILTDETMVTFTDNSAGDDITSWFWDFGDMNTSTDQNPMHTYATAGTYNVCLTVTNAAGQNTYCEDVTVTLSGIDDFIDLGFSFYPNPVSDILYIDSTIPEFEVEVLDVSGQLILIDKNTSQLILSDLNPGVYFINVITEQGIQAERLIVR